MIPRITCSLLLTLLLATQISAQELLYINHGCHFDGDETNKEVYGYPPSDEAQQIISQITAIIGLEQNFIIKAANVPNALATSEGRQRYVLYSTTFLERFKRNARTPWAAYCVLAHEIGHHLNNHDFGEQDSRKRKLMELAADRFAGNILQKMGASLEEAQAGINTFSLDGETDTHPPKSARLEAVASAWKQAKEGVTITFTPYVAPKTAVDNEKLADEWFDKGIAEKKDMHKKIEFYTKAIQLKPNYASAFHNRGWAKRQLGQYKEAIKDFDKAILLNPNDANAFHNRGFTKNKLGKYKEAIKDYNQAVQLKPNNSSTFYNRGNAKYDLGEFNNAVKDFDKAIQLKPDYIYAFVFRGSSKKKLKKYEEAVKDYDEAIKLDPNYALAYANKGCTLVALGKYGTAIDNIKEAEKLKPSFKTTTWTQDCKKEALSKL